MESTIMNLGKGGRREENEGQYAFETLESKGETLESERCRRKLDPRKTLILNIRRSRAGPSYQDLFLQNIHSLFNSIPKHITTFDEKYVLRCLELIRNYALRAAVWKFTSKVDIFSDDVSNLAEIKNRSSNNMARLAIGCPLVGRTDIIMNSTDDWTIGTVSGSRSMINILKSSLLQQFGTLDCDVNFGRTVLFGVSEPFSSEFASLQDSSSFLSRKQQKEVKVLHQNYICDPMHKRDASISSTNSSCSDKLPSSSCGTSFQGMLQCTWKDGLPHHVFTVDDKREVYVADLSKVEDKSLDYVYTFYSRRNGKKECNIHNLELESVAKMQVSTSITVFSNSSKVRETQFILSVSSDNHTRDIQTSNHALRRNKRLTRKVVDVFRSKQVSPSKLGGSSAIFEDAPWDPAAEMHNNCLDSGEAHLEDKYVPNLELAAIIVKDICDNRKEVETGGWGLKFLKRPKNHASLGTSVTSKCSRNTGECSTSMDVLIPAGIHGGPRTRVGGPSSLTERWISGGRCDCGGWDIGCPLTILGTRSSSMENSSRADHYGECKSIDLFMQGSKRNAPIINMVNIHEGLYYIHFQPTLSTLQSFAIAAAIIHSHSPVLRSKVYRN